jgi:hypothetical protein
LGNAADVFKHRRKRLSTAKPTKLNRCATFFWKSVVKYRCAAVEWFILSALSMLSQIALDEGRLQIKIFWQMARNSLVI